MDSHEYKIILKKIDELYANENYSAAAKLANRVDWKREHSVKILNVIATIYRNVQNYEAEKKVLTYALDSSNINRITIKNLVECCINLKEYDEAESYFKDYVYLAKNDSYRFVLKYKIEKGKGRDISELIRILETYCEWEMDEEMMFELAYLYHKAGLVNKCVEECDDIILWFGNSDYMLRAMELKMRYAPLTKIQQEKYEALDHSKYVAPSPSVEPEEIADELNISVQPFDAHNRYNTINLQQNLSKNVKQVINEMMKDEPAETETVVPDIPTGYTGELYLEPQITGQLSFDDFFADLEEKKERAFENMAEMNAQSRESMLASPMISSEGISSEHMASERKKKETEIEKAKTKEYTLTRASADEILDDILKDIDYDDLSAFGTDFDITEEIDEDGSKAKEQEKEEPPVTAELDKEESSNVQKLLSGILSGMDLEIDDEDPDEDSVKEDVSINKEDTQVFEDLDAFAEPETAEVEDEVIDADFIDEESLEETPLNEESGDNNVAPSDKASEDSEPEKDIEIPEDPTTSSDAPANYNLTDDERKLFGYFAKINGFDYAIAKTLYALDHNDKYIYITGLSSSNRISLAKLVIEAHCRGKGLRSAKLAVTSGKGFNQKNVKESLSNHSNGYIIIDMANEMNSATADNLEETILSADFKSTVILSDSASQMKDFFQTYPNLKKLFRRRLAIPVLTNKELVYFAHEYAEKKGYIVDESAESVLYDLISQLQRGELIVNTNDIMAMIDDAINKKKMNNFGLFKKTKEVGREARLIRDTDLRS